MYLTHCSDLYFILVISGLTQISVEAKMQLLYSCTIFKVQQTERRANTIITIYLVIQTHCEHV